MSVVEAIYLVAAVLWIVVVVAAACVGGHYLVKLRARRRQVTGLIDTVRLSIEHAISPYRQWPPSVPPFFSVRLPEAASSGAPLS